MVNVDLEDTEAIDSKNAKEAILNSEKSARNILLEESLTLSLRMNNWKYIAPLVDKPAPAWLADKDIETGFKNAPQLYDLSKDEGEQNNLAISNKELVAVMQSKIDSIVNFH